MEPDYKKMYAYLCAAASDAIDLFPKTKENRFGIAFLCAALVTAEEMYIAAVSDKEEE